MEEPILAEREASLRDYVSILFRRRYALLLTFAIVFAVGAAYTVFSPYIYRSTQRIVVKNDKGGRGRLDLPLEDIFQLNAGRDVQTQMEVVRSQKVRNQTIEVLRKAINARADLSAEDKQEKLNDLESVRANVLVSQLGDTDVLEVSVESRKPGFAREYADALPIAYGKLVQDARSATVIAALDFVKRKLKGEKKSLDRAEQELEEFKREKRFGDAQGEQAQGIQTYAQAKDRLQQLQSQVSGAEAALSHLKSVYKNLPRTLSTPVTVTNRTERDTIKDRIAILETQLAGLTPDFKENHPRVLAVKAQITDLQQKLARTPETVTTTTVQPNPEVLQYQDKIADAQGQLTSLKVAAAMASANALNARGGLTRAAALEMAQAPFERAVARYVGTVGSLEKSEQDLSLRIEAVEDPVDVITPAGKAIQVAPRPIVNMVLASFLGLLLGIGIVALQEYFDDRVNVGDDMRRLLGGPVLAAVPLIGDSESRMIHGKRRDSSLVETFRMLRTGVRFATVDAPATSLLVTSAFPGEGKSMVSTNLAVSLAMSGNRVILVDTDLRRPSLHDKFDLNRQPGLTTVLIGHCTIEDAMQDVGVPGLKVLTTGPLPPNPAELLGSHAMKELHAHMREIADIVIFDSPPALAAADAQVLASEVNGVIVVSVMGNARKSALHFLGELMAQVNAKMLGVVVTKVPADRTR